MAEPKYELLDQVEVDNVGTPVKLRLQRRHDVSPVFVTLSWRTEYPDSGKNMRFAWAEGGACWTVPVRLVRRALESAERKGMLDPRHDDPYIRFGGGVPEFVDSTELPMATRNKLWTEITTAEREPQWGESPQFMIATEPGGRWRKIFIVDTAGDFASLRSSTTNGDYRPIIHGRNPDIWHMDMAMQDASTAIMRGFLSFLRRHDTGGER